jgi:predicted GIY-YIG superfamily endonuclease
MTITDLTPDLTDLETELRRELGLHPEPMLSFTPDSDLSTAFKQAAQAAAERPARTGTVYLLHFDRPYRHAGHYCGFAANLAARLAEHDAGHGARLLAVVKAAGIGWTLARTWPGTRHTERALKRQGGAARRCPLCGITPRLTFGGTP